MILAKHANKTLAIHLLRLSFGINYFFHGLVRLPELEKFVSTMQSNFQESVLPPFLVTPVAYTIPFAEMMIGLFLMLNKYTRETLMLTFLLMNVLVIGSSFVQRWDLVGLQSTYIGFLFLLLYFMNDQQTAKTIAHDTKG